MWGRDKKQDRINDLERELDSIGAAHRDAKKINTALSDRVSVLQRHVHDAERARDETLDDKRHLAAEIDRLARWFQDNAPHEIKQGGAVDNAIRLLGEQAAKIDDLTALLDDANGIMGTQDAEIKQLKLDNAALGKRVADDEKVLKATQAKAAPAKRNGT